MATKKLLIATLGNPSSRRKVARAGEGKAYDELQYEMKWRDSLVSARSSFVAELEIKAYNPDIVVVMGTARSGWSALYENFMPGDSTGIDNLDELIDSAPDKDATDGQLDMLEAEMQAVYDHIDLSQKLPNVNASVYVCLVKYGLDDAQLQYNYSKVAKLERFMEGDEVYEIAFDITHSFRSLPMYTLASLNYLQLVSGKDIEIRHIFYGMSEVRRENNGIVPVVDLGEVTNILSLTNAASEFKATGNAVTLKKVLPREQEELAEALDSFDFAMQINVGNMVNEALLELEQATRVKTDSEFTLYGAAKSMVRAAITESGLLDLNPDTSLGDRQLVLCLWFQKQNRYGMASAVASEALHSFITPFYLELIHKPVTPQNCTDIGIRSDVDNMIQDACKIEGLAERMKKAQDFLVKLSDIYIGELDPITQRATGFRKIRNAFAHNLENAGEFKEYEKDYKGARQRVDNFIEVLCDLKDVAAEYHDEFVELFRRIRLLEYKGPYKMNMITLLKPQTEEKLSYDEEKADFIANALDKRDRLIADGEIDKLEVSDRALLEEIKNLYGVSLSVTIEKLNSLTLINQQLVSRCFLFRGANKLYSDMPSDTKVAETILALWDFAYGLECANAFIMTRPYAKPSYYKICEAALNRSTSTELLNGIAQNLFRLKKYNPLIGLRNIEREKRSETFKVYVNAAMLLSGKPRVEADIDKIPATLKVKIMQMVCHNPDILNALYEKFPSLRNLGNYTVLVIDSAFDDAVMSAVLDKVHNAGELADEEKSALEELAGECVGM